jgi:general L-amino acid transport system permease protein
LVGLINTLTVAIPGWFLATLIGVLIGVFRLSKSWITARLMTIYIEVLRNVPVVIWLVVLYGVVTLIAPQPNAFRGEDPTASMIFGSVAITNRGTYFPALLFENSFADLFDPVSVAAGGALTRLIGAMALSGFLDWLLLIVVFIAGSVAAFRLADWARKKQEATGVRPSVGLYQVGAVAIPVLIVLVALGGHLEFPELKGFNFQGGVQLPNSYLALLLGLSIYTSSYIAENVRAGIEAVSHGQTEAAYALGLRPGRTMRLIVLPQALRVIIPPLISHWLNLTKNTSLGIFVTYTALKATLGGITMNQTGRELECNFLMMGIYLTISLLISALLNVYNRAVRLKER